MKLSTEQYGKVRDALGGYVTGCPEPAVRYAIEAAAEEYVRDIGGIRFDAPLVCDSHGVFRITAPNGGTVTNLRRVITAQGELDLGRVSVGKDDDGGMVLFLMEHSGVATFATVEWRPGPETDELPEPWFGLHRGAIVAGTLVKLLTQTTKPWADSSVAMQFADDYRCSVHDALYDLHAGRDGRISMFDRNATFI